jgi:hypothetical protein
MVLTRDIAECRQIYNNYGNLNNLKLVSTYGFFDLDCQTDFVSLHRELFYETSINVPKQAAQFWKDHGYETVKRLVAENEWAQAKWTEMETLRDPHSSTTGEEFVHWSLGLNNKGPTITCLVWGFLCVLFDKEETYENNVDAAIRAVSQLFRQPPPPDFDCTTFTDASRLFEEAFSRRKRRYHAAVESLFVAALREEKCLEKRPSNLEDLIKLRRELARWSLVTKVYEREMSIGGECVNWFLRMRNQALARCQNPSHLHTEIIRSFVT